MKPPFEMPPSATGILVVAFLVAGLGSVRPPAFGDSVTTSRSDAAAASVSTATPGRAASEATPAAGFRGVGEPSPAAWTFWPAGEAAQSFQVTVSGFRARATPEGYVLSIPGQTASPGRGFPDLPSVATLLPGRPGSTARVELSAPAWTELSGVRVAPAESRALGDVTTNGAAYRVARTPDPQVYGVDGFWPPAVAQIQEAWMGTGKIVRLKCFLIQYNPARNVIRYASRLEGKVVFEPGQTPTR